MTIALPKVIGCDDHRKAAREMVSESSVLLKNDGNLLPLKIGPANDGRLLRIALIGPLVDDTANLPGTWSVNAEIDECVSIGEAFRDQAAASTNAFTYHIVQGCNLVDDVEEAAAAKRVHSDGGAGSAIVRRDD